MTENLKGKVAVITGGSGILCFALAKGAAQAGMKIALLGRTESKLQACCDELTAMGTECIYEVCDVTDKDSVIRARDDIMNKFGKVDVLVNGAGGNHPMATTTNEEYSDGGEVTFFDLEPSNIMRVFEINFMGTLIPSQVFGEVMMDKDTTIINISSMSAYHPMTKVCAYSAAKAAVSNFTEWLSVNFAKSGVRVNAIAPGFFLTEQNKTLMKKPDGSFTNRAEKVIRSTPMGRFGQAEELIGTFLWLCDSTVSGFVTGAVVPVDGGFNAYSGV